MLDKSHRFIPPVEPPYILFVLAAGNVSSGSAGNRAAINQLLGAGVHVWRARASFAKQHSIPPLE